MMCGCGVPGCSGTTNSDQEPTPEQAQRPLPWTVTSPSGIKFKVPVGVAFRVLSLLPGESHIPAQRAGSLTDGDSSPERVYGPTLLYRARHRAAPIPPLEL